MPNAHKFVQLVATTKVSALAADEIADVTVTIATV
jgi:hypothetical protein